MALSWYQAKQITEVVSADLCCRAVIEDSLGWGESLGWAGGIRNFALILGGLYDDDREHFDAVSCVGIAMRTSEAINAATPLGSKGGKAALPFVRNSSVSHRVSSLGVHHEATWIVMSDMSEYVFDWHATLKTRNPLISRRPLWPSGKGALQFVEFPAAGWH